MAPTATLTATSSTTSTTPSHSHRALFAGGSSTTTRPAFGRSLRKLATAASTPDLSSLYAAQGSSTSPVSSLSRKGSLALLTPSSLASIPDVSEAYALDSVLSDSTYMMTPATPGQLSVSAVDVVVGDAVDVPGGMHGIVRFIGSVQGKRGTFAGIDLHADHAAKGKNNGDVDGIAYFLTTLPGAGIFVPVSKVTRRGFSHSAVKGFPMTPTPSASAGLRNMNHATTFTPPTPGRHQFSVSVGPAAKAPSPHGRKPRMSLPRSESPVRRVQMTPGPRPSISAPVKVPPRYGSPTNKFSQSVRGAAVDPSKKIRLAAATGSRSASALGSTRDLDDEAALLDLQRVKTNGSTGSASSSSNLRSLGPVSRANAANEEELERLRTLLEDRDRQLREQTTTLADMESSLVELQTLMEHPDGLAFRRNRIDDKDTAQLRHLLREKSEKVAMLTTEFDAHRADFRSTIDTLEMASSETERVYEKRIEELMIDLRELESRNLDVESVASQLKQLEELVQELEEGLEDARRGEAEARGEAEFLRGEVERTRTELRRERDKAESGGHLHGEHAALSKELEKKEDEIRGLKAIIHSLSRDSILDQAALQRPGSLVASGDSADTFDNKMGREELVRQMRERQALAEQKNTRQALTVQMNTREADMEQESDALQTPVAAHQPSVRDSRDTVIPAPTHERRSREATHKRSNTLGSMRESDAYSTATETSTLWCEICETGGHDLLTCTNMFASDGPRIAGGSNAGDPVANPVANPVGTPIKNLVGLRRRSKSPIREVPQPDLASSQSPSTSPAKSKTMPPTTMPPVKILPNPMESGPVAGKESGIMDPEKWCAVCERDGHDSVDCPFEDAF
ncbi:hypothetical protein RJ55_01445 [Drechmeria coniospora]|nr:hypothetical protein RJ55_01445 [Drechmeria coniospora]